MLHPRSSCFRYKRPPMTSRRCGDWSSASSVSSRSNRLVQVWFITLFAALDFADRNEVIGSALNLLLKELSNLGISLASNIQAEHIPVNSASDPSQPAHMYSPSETASQPMIQSLPQLFEPSMADGFGYNGIQMNPAAYQAMSSLEPLTVRVGAIHDSGHQGPVP